MRSSSRSILYDQGVVAECGDVAAAPVSIGRRAVDLAAAQREIDTLRSINAHLVRQIEALKRREAQALRLADRDGLTGLYNRRKMLELLETTLADAAQQGSRVGVLFIDLDGFKGVNDRHGHAVGDKLLMSVAARLGSRARTGDVVCRYGGDEFVVILPRVADLAALRRVALSIARRLALPYSLDGIDVSVTAAIGAALYPDAADSGAELLRRADESMFRAKARVAPSPNDVAAPARRRDDPAGSRLPH